MEIKKKSLLNSLLYILTLCFISCHKLFESLYFQVLSKYNVSHAGIPAGGLKTLCPNVVDLDLSSNLLDNWLDALNIMAGLPHLKFVNLSSNILHDPGVRTKIFRGYLNFVCIRHTFLHNILRSNWGCVLYRKPEI